MLCHTCSKEIPDDSLFCPYCAAPQPTAEPAGPPEAAEADEPHIPSPARRILGKIIAALLLLSVAGLVYLLSSTGAVLFPGWTAFNN